MLEVFPISEDTERSVVRLTLDGVNAAVRNTVCHLRYQVLCGEGFMVVDGVVHELYEGVVVHVKPGQAYQDMGRLSMLATSEPPFYAEQVESVEQQLPLCFGDEIAQASQAGELVV